MISGTELHKSDLLVTAEVQKEAKIMEEMFAGQMAMMGLNDRGVLLKKMRYKLRFQGGSVEAITFETTRYGMIKLHGIANNTAVTTLAQRTYYLKGKAAQDWYNPVANRMLPRLADKVAAIRADLAVKESAIIGKIGMVKK